MSEKISPCCSLPLKRVYDLPKYSWLECKCGRAYTSSLKIINDVKFSNPLEKAEEGDTSAFREIADRMEGKAKQDLGLTGLDGGPVKIEVEVKMV